MTITVDTRTLAPAAVSVIGVSRHARERQLLHRVSFEIAPHELVAVVGGSGAGKTTLLETMAGLRSPSEGTVLYDGVPVHGGSVGASRVGFVPQDDIIHRDLPLRRTLRYAARLRLPAGTAAIDADRIVDETPRGLDLADPAGGRLDDLPGGQGQRASIAVELLTQPPLSCLDEPTSGLDPSTSAEVLAVLRRLTDRGVTVVLTTHNPADIEACDRVVFLARGGHLAFAGTPSEAKAEFEVGHLSQVYRVLADESSPPTWASPVPDSRAMAPLLAQPARPARPPKTVGSFRQWLLLCRRSADVMVRNRLTLAVLIGSPVMVTAMMTVLFRAGAFDAVGVDALGPTQMVFWIAFSGFFFGITYGLLQIVGEMAVFRRERFAGLSVGAYVLSKVAVLTPVLALVAAVLLGALGALHRLPALDWPTYAALFFTLLVEAIAALALGLLASAAVADAAQATLALPMLCFPQVLFAGAIVPVAQMPAAGQAISIGMANRWAFEALGRVVPMDPSAGNTGLAAYSAAFTGPALSGWLVLAAMAAGVTRAAVWVLRRR